MGLAEIKVIAQALGAFWRFAAPQLGTARPVALLLLWRKVITGRINA